MQTSLDADYGDRSGSKYSKVIPGLGWIHTGTKNRKVGSRRGKDRI